MTESNGLSTTELSKYWYCPKDRSKLQNYHDRLAREPYFTVTRRNLSIGVQNAIALRKIPPESQEQTMELIEHMFSKDPSLDAVELVGVVCPSCGARYAAPMLGRVEDVVGTAKVLYQSTQSLQTKQHGFIRFVDHFGLNRRTDQQGQGQLGGMSFRSLWWMVWVFGIQTIVGVLILYYILGLEMKLGKRWFPLGPVLIFLGVLVAISAVSVILWNRLVLS